MPYDGPQRRIGDTLEEKINQILISQAEAKKDISHIADKMEDHDYQSQQFRSTLINRVEKMEYALHGNGKKGLVETVGDLSKASQRGAILWRLFGAILVLVIGGLILQFIRMKLGW